MEKIDKVIEILQAYKEGKTIEFLDCDCKWATIQKNDHVNENFLLDNLKHLTNMKWKVKKEPKYRPYANAEEFLKDSKEHKIWIINKTNKGFFNPVHVDTSSIDVCKVGHTFSICCDNISFESLLNNFTWQDGSPCGVVELL